MIRLCFVGVRVLIPIHAVVIIGVSVIPGQHIALIIHQISVVYVIDVVSF